LSYRVIDNFLSEEEFNNLHSIIMGVGFPWYFNEYIVDPTHDVKNGITKGQFTHYFFGQSRVKSDLIDILNPILDKLNVTALIKAKANLGHRDEVLYETGWHVDFDDIKAKTAVFYMNTNDGYTKFQETGDKVESVANRLLEFDTNMVHTGTTVTSTPSRVVLNFNYI